MHMVPSTLWQWCLMVAFSWCALGCKTNVVSKDELDGDDLEGEVAPFNEGEGDSIPVSLWSPSQRRSTAGYYFLAAEMIALKEQNVKKALPVFEAAYNLDPNPVVGGKMIAAKAAAGLRDQALLEAKKMVLLYPNEAELWYLFGQLLHEGGQTPIAIDSLLKAIKLDPTSEGPYLLLIDAYQRTEQFANALNIAKSLVENNPSSVIGWAQLSRLHLAKGQYKSALEPARKAYESQSGNPQLIQIYALVLQLNDRGKEAIPLYEQLYRLDPTDESLTQRMVELYSEVGNLETALELLQELKNVTDAARPGIELQKAYLLWELKRFEEAALILTRLSREIPDSDRLRYLSGLGQERLGNFQAAIDTYKTVLKDSTFWKQSMFRMAVSYKEMKQVDEAVRIARELVESNQADTDSFSLLASLLADNNEHDGAVKVADSGYKKFPDAHRLLFLKGVYQEKGGDIEGCIATMREVIAKDATNSSAMNYLGYLFAERGENLDEAEQLILKALELKPNDGFYLDSLGWVYYQKGDLERAEKFLNEALRLNPDEGVILEHIADLRLKKADMQGARQFYTKALAGRLDQRDRLRIEEKLRKLDS